MSIQSVERYFPNLVLDGYRKTSDATDAYNCIAWAGDDWTEKWDPDLTTGRYWPSQIRRDLSIQTFMALYEFEGGYTPCDSDQFEIGFEKIAIYVNDQNEVLHAARQLPNGAWTSKLGDCEDIEHRLLSSLEGDLYGHVAQIMKRRRSLA